MTPLPADRELAREDPVDHTKLVKAMSEPTFYPHPVEEVRFLQTHISSVFLTGDFVYKLKKPVNFGFLDFLDDSSCASSTAGPRSS